MFTSLWKYNLFPENKKAAKGGFFEEA